MLITIIIIFIYFRFFLLDLMALVGLTSIPGHNVHNLIGWVILRSSILSVTVQNIMFVLPPSAITPIMSLDCGYKHASLKIFIVMDLKQCSEITKVTGSGISAHVWLLLSGLVYVTDTGTLCLSLCLTP